MNYNTKNFLLKIKKKSWDLINQNKNNKKHQKVIIIKNKSSY
jgi:hypothetical protein